MGKKESNPPPIAEWNGHFFHSNQWYHYNKEVTENIDYTEIVSFKVGDYILLIINISSDYKNVTCFGKILITSKDKNSKNNKKYNYTFVGY